ncbi:MAG: GxxExxY protein [Armatimonadia bacterium]|jgi:GxxExxY protein|nr:GxxExxY protein [Armatimonadia bacterium]
MNKPYVDNRFPLSALTGKIIRAAQEVYYTLGPGFRELIYQRALARELAMQGLEFEREAWMDIRYKGGKVGRKRVDFIIGDETGSVMLEMKAKGELENVDVIQALSYLKASGYKVGLLLNFGAQKLGIKRLAN